MFSWLNTIRSRLYLAFGLAASMTVVASLFALYASADISTTLAEIVSRSMPATTESLRLTEEASTLVASDAAAKTRQVANDVLNAGGELAGRSDKLRAAVERFLAQVRVA